MEFVSRAGAEKYRVVDFSSASREGEPFDALIAEKKFLPNAVMRFCTEELKIKPIKMFSGMEDDETMVGVRADESHRIPKMRARGLQIPLVEARIGKDDIRVFWRAQSFDLGLLEVNGITPDGNCDNCFLKSLGVIVQNAQRKPAGIVWWARKENETGGTFAKDRPPYAAIEQFAASQGVMFDPNEEAIPCFCGE
jgi:3'-phosphoadenosine 5'-phosphosulfate sulfotransferase (PAPS reductase)/FAD synthetase